MNLQNLWSLIRHIIPHTKLSQARGSTTFHPANGQVLIPGELQLIKLIAEHGMGSVWKAHDFKLKKEVVVKFPLSSTRAGAAMLAEEFKFMERLQHENIVQVFGMRILDKDILCIEEELLMGQDFDSWRCEQPQLCFPWYQIKDYAFQVLKAVAYAHAQNICHRDIKPQNIMRVDVTGKPSFAKIIDFGIASQRHRMGTLASITTGAHTLDYVSPEQLGGLGAHPADDVYSFCATLYHLLTGCVVFEGISGKKEDLIRYSEVPDPNQRLAASQVGFRIPEEVVRALFVGLRKSRGGEHGRPVDITRIRRLLERTPEETSLIGCKHRWQGDSGDKARIACSGLMVIEGLRESLSLDDFFRGRNLQFDHIPHKWDRSILQKINEQSLDGAIINVSCLQNFKSEYPTAELEVVCGCAKSMSGQCFYLMGAEKTYAGHVKFQDLPELLLDNTIYVNDLPEHKCAIDSFISEVLPESKRNRVKIDVVDAGVAFQLLRDNPRSLVYFGQNFRLIARQRDGFVELVNFTDCPQELQQRLEMFTQNCFVVNRKFGEFVGVDKLKAHCEGSQKAFAKKCRKQKERREIIGRISSRIDDYDLEENEFQEAMEQVLIQTFSPR